MREAAIVWTTRTAIGKASSRYVCQAPVWAEQRARLAELDVPGAQRAGAPARPGQTRCQDAAALYCRKALF